ncbi:LysR family transcriptional regulator [Chromobacterium sinusclupearum]|uniref:LysR family transcriptional regulator n=1 Tax=Chromobacterium sinusclupearum TaxID=2077146 RepID=A0A2K4MQL3_9NEIS|nr:LysR family transcriptional regulator [Chromobacterium sinusclupearum]POA99309.1 LysR family transcriptional regulator [Chromobacterium sinusclupearum]
MMNWNDVRFFLAIYRNGTLSAAARLLAVDQATVGRRLAAMESSLGSRLFLRGSSGYTPTPLAEKILAEAMQVEQAALKLESKSQGQDNLACGRVRIATTDTLAQALVIPAMTHLRSRHPRIECNLVSGQELISLTRREADIAIRTVKPNNPDLIVRKLADLSVHLYASQVYLDRRGTPLRGTQFIGHELLLPLVNTGWTEMEKLSGEPIGQGTVAARFSSLWSMLSACASGIGIAELPDFVAAWGGDMRQIWPEQDKTYPIWLVVPPDLYKTSRVRAVIDMIDEVLSGKGPAIWQTPGNWLMPYASIPSPA